MKVYPRGIGRCLKKKDENHLILILLKLSQILLNLLFGKVEGNFVSLLLT